MSSIIPFTPTVYGATSEGDTTYTAQLGGYLPSGDYILVNIYVAYSAATGTGDLMIGNLPYTVVAPGINPIAVTAVEGSLYVWPIGSTMLSGQFVGGTTTAIIRGLSSLSMAKNLQIQNTPTIVQINGIYRIT